MKFIKNAFKVIIKFFLRVLPTKKGRVLFVSFNGHYSDSPKAICEEIYKLNRTLQLVWLVEKSHMRDLPEYVKCIDISDDFARTYYKSTARVIIDNDNMGITLSSEKFFDKICFKLLPHLLKKKNQKYYTTWHGTPLKRMGRDVDGSNIIDYNDCANTTMILGNQFAFDIMSNIMFGKVKAVLIGTPRNDILFKCEKKVVDLRKKIGLPLDKKIIMFAPTFRSDDGECKGRNVLRSGVNQLKEIDFTALFETLCEKFSGEWAIVCRFHYFVEKMVDWESLQREYPNQIINGNLNDDMAEYLACTDVLLTDASSSMFDFMLTKKPCFLFFPDLKRYRNIERGFYTPIESLPFSTAETFGKLIENIKGFDEKSYTENVEKLICEFGYVDDANSSERIAKYILNELK